MEAIAIIIVIVVIVIAVVSISFDNKKKIKKLEELIYISDKTKAKEDWDALQNFMSDNEISDKKYDKVREAMYIRLAENDDLLALQMAYVYKYEDKDLAYKYLLRAAQLGDEESMYTLGLQYDECSNKPPYNDGFGNDPVKSFNWYYKAAQKGHEKAANMVASAYYFGDGVKQDKEKAFEYAKYFSDRGFSELSIFLVRYFYCVTDTLKIDDRKAITLLKRVMCRKDREKYSEAASLLGWVFMRIYNSSGDEKEASYIRNAAYCYYLAYCTDNNQYDLSSFKKTGYRATQFELNTWGNDAKNLRYNPQ